MKWSIPLLALGMGLLISCGADTSEIAASSDVADSSGASFAANGGKCSLAPRLTMCKGNCVDVQTDVNNCGACGRACPTSPGLGSSCLNGTCACAQGFTLCNDTCVNLRFDSYNCGTCGNACDGGSPCRDWICPWSCPLTCPEGYVCHFNSPCTRTCWTCVYRGHGRPK
jgi:hypothetical protein